jgi:hypothetical protein
VKKKRITRNRPTLYAIQDDAKNKKKKIKKKECRLYHEISLSSNALPRTSLPTGEGSPLSFILPFIYFASRLLCDGSGPKKTKKPIQDQMQRRSTTPNFRQNDITANKRTFLFGKTCI